LKRNILFVAILLLSNFLFSQQYQITGRIVNEKNKPIEFAELLLLNKDSIAIKSELSDEKGFFSIDTKQESYIFQIKQSKKITYTKNIEVFKNLDLGIIKVENSTTNIQEVVIPGKKKLIERKVDRLVFNVENSISASGGDAIDALKITPSIRINDDKISMIGKKGLSVMVDDKLIQLNGDDLTNFLKSIPSSNIKNIEVITTPPAKYDAEGNSGIVNIKLKKAKKDSWNASLNSSYKQTIYPTANFGGDLNYQKNKISFFSNINYQNGITKRIEKDEIYYSNQSWITDFNKKNYSDIISGRVGIDYKITGGWTTGIQYLGNKSKPKTYENDYGKITKNTTNQVDSLINTTAKNLRNNFFHSLNWHNIITIDTIGRKITTDFDYFTLQNNDNRDFITQNLLPNNQQTPSGILSTNNIGLQKINNYSGKIDFEHPLKWANLSYGSKFTFTETVNSVLYYNTTTGTPILNTNQSNSFNFNENTQAIYVSGSKKFGKEKWDIQLGVRLENTQTKGLSVNLNQKNTNNYFEFFPTAYVSYKQNENHLFSIDFSRRIERPGFRDLNPFKFYSSAYSYTEGNPFLLPQFSNNLGIKHTYKNFLTTSLSYSHETQGFGEVPFVNNSNNIQYFSQLNYFTFDSYDISESYVFNKYDWWESNLDAYIYYSYSKFTQSISLAETKGLSFYLSTNNTFILNKKKNIKVGLNYWYQASEYDLLNKKRQTQSLDVSMKFSLLQNNLLLAITAQDLFNTNKAYKTTNTNNIFQVYSSHGSNQFFKIAVTYKFGSKKINVEKRNFGNDDEKERAK
jgi:hypothetical protein